MKDKIDGVYNIIIPLAIKFHKGILSVLCPQTLADSHLKSLFYLIKVAVYSYHCNSSESQLHFSPSYGVPSVPKVVSMSSFIYDMVHL